MAPAFPFWARCISHLHLSTLRRFHRFLVVSIGRRGSPIIRRVAGRSRYIVHRLHTPRRATP